MSTTKLLGALALLSSSLAFAGVDPSSVKIKIYGVAVSKKADCSNAKVIGHDEDGTVYDFMKNPTLVKGDIDPGTYPCVILYMDSLLKVTPSEDEGAGCDEGEEFVQNVCSGENSCTYTEASPDSDGILDYGSDVAASGADRNDTDSDKVLLFLSTQSDGDGSTNGTFRRPTTDGSTNGQYLDGALKVKASGTTGTFIVNFNGKIEDDSGQCSVGVPVFGFR